MLIIRLSSVRKIKGGIGYENALLSSKEKILKNKINKKILTAVFNY